MEGLKRSVAGETPFLLSPLTWGAKKLFGEKKVNDAIWKYMQSPLVKADIALGDVARRATKKITGGTGGLFLESKLLPMGKPNPKTGRTGRVEVDVPSIMAPITSVGKFTIPLLGIMKAEEMLKGDRKMNNNPVITKADLNKTAAMLESLKGQKNEYEKKAQATKLLFKQAELGHIIFPKTHNEFQEKVAELMQKDLKVVEEAIKMATASEELSNTFGSLNSDSNPSKGGNAQEAFQRSLME